MSARWTCTRSRLTPVAAITINGHGKCQASGFDSTIATKTAQVISVGAMKPITAERRWAAHSW